MVYHNCESHTVFGLKQEHLEAGLLFDGIRTVKKLCVGKKSERKKEHGTILPTHVARSRILDHVLVISTIIFWLVVWNMAFIFHFIYWEFHHPN